MTPYFAITQGMVLILALYFSFLLIEKYICFLIKGFARLQYYIPQENLIIPSILWGIFFVMQILSK